MKTLVVMSAVLAFFISESTQKSTEQSSSYKSAVVEYEPVVYKDDPERTLKENADEFVKFIGKAANRDVDIIVFPEFGLTSLDIPEKSSLFNWSTLVPAPEENFRPCTDSKITVNKALKDIACNATQNNIYVAVNVIEREQCLETGCPSYGYFYYSTNVVFDPEGILVARYRRSYQSDDLPAFDHPKVQETSTFTTKFGVKFANVIGLDIMYQYPLLDLLEKEEISDVVYTAAWRNVMPFQTSIQIQSGWAYTKNVNLLAAGLHQWEKGYSGSGIYAGRLNILESTIGRKNKPEEFLSENVSKKLKSHPKFTSADHGHHVHDEFRRSVSSQAIELSWENLEDFESVVIEGSKSSTLTHNGITCDLRVDVKNLSSTETYRFVAHDTGLTTGNVTVRATRICAIIQCADATSLKSCNRVRPSAANFASITISASYVDNEQTLMMPSTLISDLMPLNDWTFDERVHEGRTINTISLSNPTQNLATFGIWGRNFEADNPRHAQQYTSNYLLCFTLLVVSIILCGILIWRYFAVKEQFRSRNHDLRVEEQYSFVKSYFCLNLLDTKHGTAVQDPMLN